VEDAGGAGSGLMGREARQGWIRSDLMSLVPTEEVGESSERGRVYKSAHFFVDNEWQYIWCS